MPLHRRQLFTVLGIASLVGCTPDPTIHGDPARAVVPPEPTQEPTVVELTAALAALNRAVSTEPAPWRDQASAQVGAWAQRLRLVAPLHDGEPHFPLPEAGGEEDLAQAISRTTDATRSCVEEASGQAMRLLHLSILAGATGLLNVTVPPGTGGGAPAPFNDVPTPQVLPVALGHVLALQQGLERGLALLPREDPLREQLTQRRTETRFLRNRITEAIGPGRPLQDAHHELPTIDATTFAAVWADLELAVLNGLLGLAATADTWVAPAVDQVAKVQAAGGQLPTWPGWVNVTG